MMLCNISDLLRDAYGVLLFKVKGGFERPSSGDE